MIHLKNMSVSEGSLVHYKVHKMDKIQEIKLMDIAELRYLMERFFSLSLKLIR